MANVLSETKRQQVVALGRLGWPLRRIEDATRVRREQHVEMLTTVWARLKNLSSRADAKDVVSPEDLRSIRSLCSEVEQRAGTTSTSQMSLTTCDSSNQSTSGG